MCFAAIAGELPISCAIFSNDTPFRANCDPNVCRNGSRFHGTPFALPASLCF